MPTKFDRSKESGTLVTCTDCPYWFAFQWTEKAAQDSACSHEERVHPGRTEASSRRAKHDSRARHAVAFSHRQ
jgi:hypothetical protein